MHGVEVGCPFRVRLGNTRCEQMFSVPHLIADIEPRRRHVRVVTAAKSKTEFNGVGGLLTYISFTPAKARSDDMSDRNQWISYSHWGTFLTGTKHLKKNIGKDRLEKKRCVLFWP
jgi:hypothetical protein